MRAPLPLQLRTGVLTALVSAAIPAATAYASLNFTRTTFTAPDDSPVDPSVYLFPSLYVPDANLATNGKFAGNLPTPRRAALFDRTGHATQLPDPIGHDTRWTEAGAASATGWVVGNYFAPGTSSLRPRTIRWAPDGTATVLTEAGYVGAGYDVNDSGQALATDELAGGGPGGWVRWEPDGTYTRFARPTEGASTLSIEELNNAGTAVGGYNSNTGYMAAYWPNPSTIVRLAAPGVPAQDTNGLAFDLSNTGDIVGYVVSGGANRAVHWSPDGTPAFLPDVPGQPALASVATGIDDAGRIVGFATYAAPSQFDPNATVAHAVLWDSDGTAHFLQDFTSGYTLPQGPVNLRIRTDGGFVYVHARPQQGSSVRYVLSSPVPEPASMVFLAVTFPLVRRRRRLTC